jgi:hypothetical protein
MIDSTKTQAQTFAASIIPDFPDPIWTNAARELLAGVVIMLIKTHGAGKWNYRDLADALNKTPSELNALIQEYCPPGTNLFTDIILMNLRSSCDIIYCVAILESAIAEIG